MLNKNEENLIEARRAYFRNWRKNNKEKVKKYNETFWAKKLEMADNKTKLSEHKP